ncbi:MAG: RNase adapter RapZ [Firmicutes bacterium]|nr:RNase adapter RapZ [Bacillota bacterium]
MELLIVTGLSGAGKSNAVNILEDLGWYCIDNMPPALLRSFISLEDQNKIHLEKAAFVMDIRGRAFFEDLEKELAELKAENKPFRVLFLEANNETLIRRYKETRRIHPLSEGKSEVEAIREERRMLDNIRKNADYIIDTSNIKASQLQTVIQEMLDPTDKQYGGFRITVMSFGYKHGMPLDGEMVYDVRFIPNPFYNKSMKHLTGNNRKVRDYCMRFEETQRFIHDVSELVKYLIPFYIKQGKRNLVLAFGCTGGQHRSVSMANEIYDILTADGWNTNLIHRDINKR